VARHEGGWTSEIELQITCLRTKIDNLKVQRPNQDSSNNLGTKIVILPIYNGCASRCVLWNHESGSSAPERIGRQAFFNFFSFSKKINCG